MRNNKGFSLIELLAVVALLGVLMALGISAFSKYKDYTVRKGYETLSESAANAAESYFMENPGATSITLEDLVDYEFLANNDDPVSPSRKCMGKVTKKTKEKGDGKKVDALVLEVTMKCVKYDKCITYPGKGIC